MNKVARGKLQKKTGMQFSKPVSATIKYPAVI
jgi:hypothetical protein